jgi:hypothetical protein
MHLCLLLLLLLLSVMVFMSGCDVKMMPDDEDQSFVSSTMGMFSCSFRRPAMVVILNSIDSVMLYVWSMVLVFYICP